VTCFGFCGLLPFGGEESVWFVRGVKPFVAALLLTYAWELWVKTEEAVLPSELAEPTPWSISPLSEVGDV
jgi:hypothetical protein